MSPDKTEYEWIYSPGDYFEAPYQTSGPGYALLAENGRLLATLDPPQDPVDAQLDSRVREYVTHLFLVRELQVHRPYNLDGPRRAQYNGEQKTVALEIHAAAHIVVSDNVDLVQRDPNGNAVSDTKAERIAAETAVLDTVTPKLGQSSVLQALVASYSNAVGDPSDELVHLYEIRDALSSHFGSASAAWAALGISKRDWDRLGVLANVEPLREGRHRGAHTRAQRPATQTELSEARALVSAWILAFASTI